MSQVLLMTILALSFMGCSKGQESKEAIFTQVLEAVQGYFKQVGVTMKVVDVEFGTLSQMGAQPVEKNQMQATLFGWRSVNGDIDSAIQDFGSAFWRPKGNNLSFWKSEEFDRLLTFEQGTLDARKRLEALQRMQEILMDELPAL